MTNYIHTTSGTYPLTEAQIRLREPDCAFPNVLKAEDVEPLGYFEVVPTNIPDFTSLQHPVEGDPILVDGKYLQTWTNVDYTPEELAQQEADKVAAAQLAFSTMLADFQRRIQQRLDDFARTRNYDGILSAASYAVSSHPPFAAEGRYCADSRDETWGVCYTLLGEVEAGTRTVNDWATLEALLPVLEWPE